MNRSGRALALTLDTRHKVLAMACCLLFALALSVNVQVQRADSAPPPKVGIVCTEGSGGVAGQPVFNLTTRTGYISLPDGNTAFMWGYSSGFDGFQHPGPVLCVNEGDTVTVILHNTLPEQASVAFPGQDAVQADGVPAAPETNGSGRVTSLTTSAAAGGGTVTYSFVADRAGTFLYQSGTDPETQIRMGLFGALIVRPARADHAYNRADSQFTPTEEFMVLLSEIDPYQHQAVEAGKTFNMNNYHPRYWLINGRGFPDSIADNGADWLPDAALRSAGAGPRVQQHRPPAARPRPLSQRGHRGLPVPPARQQRPGDRARRQPARGHGR